MPTATLFLRTLLLALVLCLPSACSDDAATPAASGDARGPNPLYFIGIDGATWDVMNPMIENGELPNLAALRDRGAHGTLITVGPSVSPVVWTTFATGRFGRDHGILDFVFPYQPGPKKPVDSSLRRQRAIWNIASEHGLDTCVVGYFVSYPAEPVNGCMVSDRSIQKLPDADYPADLLSPYRELLDPINTGKGARKLWQRFISWEYRKHNLDWPNEAYREANEVVAGRVDGRIVTDGYLHAVTRLMLEEPHDLFMTYFRIVDYASHSAWYYHDHSDWDNAPDPFADELLGDLVKESYRYVDEIVGEVVAAAPTNANILIVSDHGFGSSTGRFKPTVAEHQRLSGNHRPNGIFIAAGPDITPGQVEGLTTMEVMPLMTTALRLPLSDELPGRVAENVFQPDVLDAIETVASYGPRENVTQASEIDAAAQEAELRDLQGLGYISADTELGDIETDETSLWQAAPNLKTSHLTGEILYYLLQQDVASAMDVLREAQRRDTALARRLLNVTRDEYQVFLDYVPRAAIPEATFDEFFSAARSLNVSE